MGCGLGLGLGLGFRVMVRIKLGLVVGLGLRLKVYTAENACIEGLGGSDFMFGLRVLSFMSVFWVEGLGLGL